MILKVMVGGCFGEKKRDYHAEYERVSKNTEASRIYKSALKTIDNCKEIAYGIDYAILEEFCRVCKHPYIYIWCSKKQIYPLMQFFVGQKGFRFEILVWLKSNPIPTCNGKYLSDSGNIFMANYHTFMCIDKRERKNRKVSKK